MYITYHGSWNRSPVTGFKLVAVQFKISADGNYTPVEPLTSTTAAKDIFYNPNVESCQGNGPGFSSGCFRPAGLAWDSVRPPNNPLNGNLLVEYTLTFLFTTAR